MPSGRALGSCECGFCGAPRNAVTDPDSLMLPQTSEFEGLYSASESCKFGFSGATQKCCHGRHGLTGLTMLLPVCACMRVSVAMHEDAQRGNCLLVMFLHLPEGATIVQVLIHMACRLHANCMQTGRMADLQRHHKVADGLTRCGQRALCGGGCCACGGQRPSRAPLQLLRLCQSLLGSGFCGRFDMHSPALVPKPIKFRIFWKI